MFIWVSPPHTKILATPLSDTFIETEHSSIIIVSRKKFIPTILVEK